MTEEKMKKEYEVLYKLYTISTMLTENANQLSKDTRGYGIHKRTIWKNLHICKDYDCENTYMSEYPAMSYKLSTDTNIRNNMQFIEDIIMISDDLIDDEFIAEFVNNESNCIDLIIVSVSLFVYIFIFYFSPFSFYLQFMIMMLLLLLLLGDLGVYI